MSITELLYISPQIRYLQISTNIGMELYREEGFLARSRAQNNVGNLILSCKGQLRLAVYTCTQCKSQIWQGAEEVSDVGKAQCFLQVFENVVLSMHYLKN